MSIPAIFSAPPIRHFTRKIPAGKEVTIDVYGSVLYVKEAEYSFLTAFDDSDFMPWDLAVGVDFTKFNYAFKKIRFKNTGSADSTIEIFAGFFDLSDRRLNIVESRNGSAASEVPTGFAELSHTFVSTAPVELVGLDYNRYEIWLAADTFGTAWFGADNATMAGGTGTADFRRVGLSFDGFTKLKTKAPVWIRGNVGATVRALVFTY